ncbi:hypothetical protein [Actinomadura montaniterrae]|uniref:Uncharacterized protein n=1 Tax=Actinomadura montaniterrae TaxID=1803903 RepID=A0A6L3VBP8_9ACTN|nr:hypothetical protein [Actinomadura montaniterrae]KAB2353024.1 hypothetical protein F9B16_49880 [Actinomadura montaniterrae]
MNARTLTHAAAYAGGLALIGYGLSGIVADVPVGRWAAWFAGAAVLHDGVLVPAVLVAGAVTGWIPVAYRRVLRGALLVAACVTAVAIPLVLGYGRRPDVPSQLPLPYGRNLAIVVGVIGAVAVAVLAAQMITRRRRRDAAGGGAHRAVPPPKRERGK